MQKLSDGRYDSVMDFIHATLSDLRNPSNMEPRDHYMTADYGDWYGAKCRTGKQVREKLASGWTEGRERCAAMLDKLDASSLVPQDRRRRFRRQDMGDTLDIQAVYMGNLDTCWSLAKRQTSTGPQRVDICANMLCYGGEDSDVLFWRGAAAITLADKLESAGYMVRIVVAFGGKKGDEKVSCRVTIKDHGMPLDIATASSVIMPGFFRAIGHSWIAGHAVEEVSSGSITVERGILEEGELDLSHGVRDESTALAWIKSVIDKLNGPQEDAA